MNDNLTSFFLPTIIAVISVAVLLVIRGIAFRVIHRWAYRTGTEADDMIINAVRTPSFYWMIAIGLYIGIEVSDLSPKYVLYLTKTIHLIVILSISYAAADLSGRIFRNYVHKSNLPIPTTGLAYGLVKGTIIVIGILFALGVFGVSITPLLTALGVGGLAVALALQDSLSNLFAGIHLLVEKSVRVGDFIKLETGQEGYVEDITWRTTRIKMQPDNMVIIPNNKLSQSVVTNYSLPEKEMSINIVFHVSYDADPEKVETLIVETARSAADEISGLLREPPPIVFIPGFGENSMDFTLNCRIRDISDRIAVGHGLRKRILKKFREEGIEIPFPQRVLHFKNTGGR